MTNLPPRDGPIYLTDSGLETDLLFNRGVELAEFAAFPLLDTAAGRSALTDYFRDHVEVATSHGLGFVFEAPTWRANADWGRALGYDPVAIERANEVAIEFMTGLAADARDDSDGLGPTVISGCVGPRSDGYHPTIVMSADDARDYHRPQIMAFGRAGADLVNAMTITYAAEAIGIVDTATAAGLPVAISFTLETDGRLPDGTSLADAIRAVDAATGGAAEYFGINCAHPDHIAPALAESGDWTTRLRALRANASRRSHAELDEATELDDGDPAELAQGYQQLRAYVPSFTVLGGCCGSDVRHVAQIAAVTAPGEA